MVERQAGASPESDIPEGGIPDISIVVPMFDEEEGIDLFFGRLLPVMEGLGLSFEVVCVNDGSRDRTLSLLVARAEADSRIVVLDLSRNFGKERALTAGLDHARGRGVIPIDADLQDPPEIIPEMVAKWQAGAEMVLAVRADRSSDHPLKRNSAALFYRLMRRLGDVPLPSNAGDFRLIDRRVLEALYRLPERTRFMKGIFAWLGFRQDIVTYTRPPRAAGTTKWKAWALWNFALDGIVSFTSAPLRVWTYLGVFTALLAAVYVAWIVTDALVFGIETPGYASLISVMLFFNGLTMIGIGMLGEYLGRVFVEVKQRPLYFVRQSWGVAEGTGPAAELPGRARISPPAPAQAALPGTAPITQATEDGELRP